MYFSLPRQLELPSGEMQNINSVKTVDANLTYLHIDLFV